jgi:hypothetical protein
MYSTSAAPSYIAGQASNVGAAAAYGASAYDAGAYYEEAEPEKPEITPEVSE